MLPNGVQEIHVVLPSSFSSVLISNAERTQAERDAQLDQRVITGVEAQEQVVAHSANDWLKLSEFATHKNMLSPDETSALRYACQIPDKVPSAYQSQKLLTLLERAISEGFHF